MIRRFIRWLGGTVHKGWKSIHPSGFTIRCVGCGEERQAYHRAGDPRVSWWETIRDGDGSCGNIRPLPPRY